MIIEVILKSMYGKKCFYPSSTDASKVCELVGKPTLTLRHLNICRDAGWPVSIIYPQITLEQLNSEQKKCKNQITQ